MLIEASVITKDSNAAAISRELSVSQSSRFDSIWLSVKVERSAITLYYLNGYSIKEIAAITETKEGAVKQQLSRGRDKLKARLQL